MNLLALAVSVACAASKVTAASTVAIVFEGTNFVNTKTGFAVTVPFLQQAAFFAGVTTAFTGILFSPCKSTREVDMAFGFDANRPLRSPSTRAVEHTDCTDFAGTFGAGCCCRSCQRKKENAENKKEDDVVLFHGTFSVERF